MSAIFMWLKEQVFGILLGSMLTAIPIVPAFYFNTNATLNQHTVAITEIKEDVGKIKLNVTDLGEKVNNINIKPIQIDERVNGMMIQISSLNDKMNKMEQRIDKIYELLSEIKKQR